MGLNQSQVNTILCGYKICEFRSIQPNIYFVDIDNDFDMDAVVSGEWYKPVGCCQEIYRDGKIMYFENVGNSSHASFILRNGTSELFNGLEGIRTYFADADNDNDTDLFIGHLDETLVVFITSEQLSNLYLMRVATIFAQTLT